MLLPSHDARRKMKFEESAVFMSVSPSLTRNQALVLDALSASAAPLSAYSLLDQLRGEGLRAPLQIYRALDKLIEAGHVHRLESLNAFVACAHQCSDAQVAGEPHSHGLIAFAICHDCGRVDEFADNIVAERLHGWSRRSHFKLEKTTIEMQGLCEACLEAGPAAPRP